ncbi:hypothetical protein ACE1CI_24030, partial [Aerosakkonemataceae cyanobacterium BLCC-F50]
MDRFAIDLAATDLSEFLSNILGTVYDTKSGLVTPVIFEGKGEGGKGKGKKGKQDIGFKGNTTSGAKTLAPAP